MASIHINPTHLTVTFSVGEKVLGLLRDVNTPLSSITSVAVEPDGLKAVRGLRAPGLAIPGRRRIGTWRGRGRRRVVSVRAGEPAVRVGLLGAPATELVLGSPDAQRIADQLRAASVPASR